MQDLVNNAEATLPKSRPHIVLILHVLLVCTDRVGDVRGEGGHLAHQGGGTRVLLHPDCGRMIVRRSINHNWRIDQVFGQFLKFEELQITRTLSEMIMSLT